MRQREEVERILVYGVLIPFSSRVLFVGIYLSDILMRWDYQDLLPRAEDVNKVDVLFRYDVSWMLMSGNGDVGRDQRNERFVQC